MNRAENYANWFSAGCEPELGRRKFLVLEYFTEFLIDTLALKIISSQNGTNVHRNA